MNNKKKLGIILIIAILISFLIGYGFGELTTSEIPEKEKSAYDLINEKVR